MAKKSSRTPAKRTSVDRDGQPTTEARRVAEMARMGMRVDPEKAVSEINRLARSGMRAIADYLVKTFFAGDLANVRGTGANSPGFVCLRRYNEQLDVGYSTLTLILRAQKQRHELERTGHGKLLEQLTLSHQFRLLSAEGQDKIQLLRQAAKNGWTVRQLSEAIAERKPTAQPKPLTARRALARVERVDRALDTAVDSELFEVAKELPKKDRTQLRRRLDKQLKILRRLRDSLGEA